MRQKYLAAGLLSLGFLAGCGTSPSQQTAAGAPQKPRQCSDVLAQQPPQPAKYEPHFLDVLAAQLKQPPEQIVANTNRVSMLFYTAARTACRDPRCGTITSTTGSLAFDPAQQKPLLVTCRNAAGTETNFSYMPAELEPAQ